MCARPRSTRSLSVSSRRRRPRSRRQQRRRQQRLHQQRRCQHRPPQQLSQTADARRSIPPIAASGAVCGSTSWTRSIPSAQSRAGTRASRRDRRVRCAPRRPALRRPTSGRQSCGRRALRRWRPFVAEGASTRRACPFDPYSTSRAPFYSPRDARCCAYSSSPRASTPPDPYRSP